MNDGQGNLCNDSTTIPIAAPPIHIPCHLKAEFDGVTQTMVQG